MDEGWTRFVLEQYGFEPRSLDNKAIRAGNLGAAFDVIVLPDLGKEVIATGKPRREEGAMRYFPEPAPGVRGRAREGGGEGAQGLRGGGRHPRRPRQLRPST